jgi:hypothetical protein
VYPLAGVYESFPAAIDAVPCDAAPEIGNESRSPSASVHDGVAVEVEPEVAASDTGSQAGVALVAAPSAVNVRSSPKLVIAPTVTSSAVMVDGARDEPGHGGRHRLVAAAGHRSAERGRAVRGRRPVLEADAAAADRRGCVAVQRGRAGGEPYRRAGVDGGIGECGLCEHEQRGRDRTCRRQPDSPTCPRAPQNAPLRCAPSPNPLLTAATGRSQPRRPGFARN